MFLHFLIIFFTCNATNSTLTMNQASHNVLFADDHYAHDYHQAKELNKKKFYRRKQKQRQSKKKNTSPVVIASLDKNS